MSEERMKVLKMIENGEISAEEGSKLLEAMNDSKSYSWKSFLGDAVDRVKKGDFDLSFGNTIDFQENEEEEATSFEDMDIHINNGSIHILTHDKETIKAEYDVKMYQAKDEEEAKQRFKEEVRLDASEDLLRLSSPSGKVKVFVTLYVPDRSYDFVKAKVFNGAVNLENMQAEHVETKTTNGAVSFTNVQGEKANVETGNGTIDFKGCSFARCDGKTVNGRIQADGSFAKLDLSTVSGGIQVTGQGHRSERGFFKTSTGSIEVLLPEQKRVEGRLASAFGKLDCKLDNYKLLSDKNDWLSKELKFEAREDYDGVYYIDADTKSGSVTVR
ncbi:DUF4097 family beta strand repeat-containing protein [Salimicrobium halophilum]|uniref:DUF4097 and DUF4098 domain-containing protein YvlB n=1 Tax=Salimicrobium halophilum TaxID=86666 RepID=A0A1G8V5B0_9BACI|nr:DUF4097 family beta strand repeat-containing protein [Salimicrobium halophilum]SDJ61034.1 DUF4097 and DUF4098 domain-containing protein YvlB [Salimicrobium halophilum]